MTTPTDLLTQKQYDDRQIAALPESEFGRIFFAKIRKRLAEADEEYFMTLKICDEDCKQDFRFKAGFIAGLKWVLQEPERARIEFMKNREGRT